MTAYEYGLFKLMTLVGAAALGFLIFSVWRASSVSM
jgi:hypothetical protein